MAHKIFRISLQILTIYRLIADTFSLKSLSYLSSFSFFALRSFKKGAKVFFVLCVCFPSIAQAQNCNAAYEVISKIRPPDIGSYNLWESVHGHVKKSEEFISGLNSTGNNTVVAGHIYKYEDGMKELMLLELDRRGRVVWKEVHKIKRLQKVIKIVKHEQGFLVIGDKKNAKDEKEVWFGFFSEKGEFIKEKNLRDKKFDLESTDFIEAWEEGSYILATLATGRGYASSSYGVVYMLDKNLKVQARRAYLPGIENKILSLALKGDRFILASGYVKADDGRRAGWVLQLDQEAKIIWQRQYARGLSAQLNSISHYEQDFVVALGQVVPGDSSNRGAWVMMLNSNSGDVGWQRYYTGTFEHYGRKVITHLDRQISILIDGLRRGKRPKDIGEDDETEYAMLLTLSPRGVVLERDTYYQGEAVEVFDMFLGKNKERILIGKAHMAYKPEEEATTHSEFNVTRSKEGWALAAASAEPYEDPCIKDYSFLP